MRPSLRPVVLQVMPGLAGCFIAGLLSSYLFRHLAPGPRPKHSMRPAAFKSRNKSRVMYRLAPGQARSTSVKLLFAFGFGEVVEQPVGAHRHGEVAELVIAE